MTNPVLFTTIKLQDSVLQAPLQHLEKLKSDYFSLNQSKLRLSLDDVTRFIDSHGHPNGTWRLNIFATAPIRYQLSIENTPKPKTYSLKSYPAAFHEPLAQFKKEDFSQRKRLLKEAIKDGVDDFIFVDKQGQLLETTICNLFWIRGKTFCTPSPDLPLYFGVTLAEVINIAERLGFEIKHVKENNIGFLLDSFVFVTNSIKEILPVHSIDNQTIAIDWELVQTFKREFEHLTALQGVL